MSQAPFRRAGEAAPELVARGIGDDEPADLGSMLAASPSSLLLFWVKTGCPTCRLALPFIDRIARAAPGRVFIVSQDEPQVLRDFCQSAGLDPASFASEAAPYASADAYGVTHVPTWFEVAQVNGAPVIRDSGMAFVRQALEDQYRALGGQGSLFKGDEAKRLPVMQPG